MEKNQVGVRKGAWTKDEDVLLTKCIEKYGEGKWHQVSLRAGLNRCGKSCRLRWLNYLRPNLKRDYFTKDEVDLIIRLHKLLGNRWSLIAGRLPGRTANDVKNFWNTHLVKKSPPAGGESCSGSKTITESNIIRPRPSRLQVPAAWPSEVTKTNEPNDENLNNINMPSSSASSLKYFATDDENPKNNQPYSPSAQEEVDECIQWWSNLLEITENGEETPFSFSDEDLFGPAKNQANQDGLSSLSVDVDVLGLVSFDQH